MIRYVYTAKGSIHPDRTGALQHAILSKDEATARRLNSMWAEAQQEAKKLGWQGFIKSPGPFVIAEGLIWDDAEKVWAATETPWLSLELGKTGWEMAGRAEVNS